MLTKEQQAHELALIFAKDMYEYNCKKGSTAYREVPSCEDASKILAENYLAVYNLTLEKLKGG